MAQQLKPFRTLLEDLYITQNVKLEDIRTFMNDQHSVNVGRGTYERLFKQWGFKKKNNGNNWEWVSHSLRKRQDAGRKSALYIKNRRIPGETVRKEISRHVSTLQQSLLAAGTAPSPQTPEGYVIATPASTVAALTPRAPSTPGDDIEESQSNLRAPVNPGTTNSPFDNERSSERQALDDEPTINLSDKAMVKDTLESCGPFSLALGSNYMSLSPSNLLEVYDYTAECIVVAPQAATRPAVPSNFAPFATSFNVLLSAYREDVEFFRNFAQTPRSEEYSDVLRAAVFMAARKGTLVLFEALWAMVGQDSRNNKGQTYLHIASIYNHPHLVEFLIGQKVQINARCRDGFTPWTAIGCLDSHEDVSRLLIAAGARIDNTRPTDSMNLLYEAALTGNIGHVRTLIRRGADPSYATPSGFAPLHIAKTLEIMQILVAAGANVNQNANAGETPFDKQSHDVAKRLYLIKAGAMPGFFMRPEIFFTPTNILSRKSDRA